MLDLWSIPVFKPSIASAPNSYACLPAAIDRHPWRREYRWMHRRQRVALSATADTNQATGGIAGVFVISGWEHSSGRMGSTEVFKCRYRGKSPGEWKRFPRYTEQFYGQTAKGLVKLTSNGLAVSTQRWRYRGAIGHCSEWRVPAAMCRLPTPHHLSVRYRQCAQCR